MECPYCKKEMRSGFVQGARGVFFSEKERILFYFPNRFKRKNKDISIANIWYDCSAPAHYCDDCEILIAKKSDRDLLD